LRTKKNILYVSIFIGIYLLIVTIIWLNEQSSTDSKSNIKSFVDALWYSIITLTTIGYGDFFPVTTIGRIAALFFVLGSVGILGFIIGQISNKITKIMEDKKLGYNGTKYENHVVIINWNSFGQQILSEIVNADQKAVVVTKSKEDVDSIYNMYGDEKVFVLHSEYFDLNSMEKANLAKSHTVLLNFLDDTENLVQLISLKTKYPTLCYVISLNNPSLKETFKSLGVTFTLSKNEVAAKLVASYVFEPQVAGMTEGLMSSGTREDDLGMMQFKVVNGNEFLGFNCQDLFIELKKQLNVILVGISKFNSGTHTLIKNPGNDQRVDVNDYLVVLGTKNSKKNIIAKFKVDEGI
jgi:voltage-gated potassium channel